MSSKTDPSRVAWALAATLTLAGVLRIVGLSSGLWYDEIATLVLSVRRPLLRIVTDLPDINTHPLYSVLAHLSVHTFGETNWAIRLPAGLFGIASVGATWTLARRLVPPVEAWSATALLATSYHHIWFSQNARAYTMLACCTIVSTHAIFAAQDTGRRRHLVVYTLASVVGVYAHLTMGFVIAGQGLAIAGAWLVERRSAALRAQVLPWLWTWLSVALLSAAVYAPFAPRLLQIAAAPPAAAAQVATAGWSAREAVELMLAGSGWPAFLAGSLFGTVGAFAVLRRRPAVLAVLVVPAVVTAAGILALGRPMRPRFFFFLSGAVAVLVAHGIGLAAAWMTRERRGGTLTSTRVAVAITLALVAATIPSLARNYRVPKQDFDGADRYLVAEWAAGAHVAVAGPACLPFDRYYERKDWPCVTDAGLWRALAQTDGRTLVVYTLVDYVADPAVADRLRTSCPEIRRFPGTLGGGDLIVCEMSGEDSP
jgi:hypothetical protein